MRLASLPSPRAFALSGLLTALAPRASRAESVVRYKYQDYQEMGGRIGVTVQSAGVEQDFGQSTHLKLEGIIDAIVGATPNGQPAPSGSDQVPLSILHERRKAWDATLSQQLSLVNISAGAANSRESDYVSNGWNVNTLWDFNQKNTTLLAGLAGSDDKIKVFYQTPRATKQSRDAILGVTQLLSPQTSLTFNVSWGRAKGYLSDPYKLVQKSTEIISGVFLPLTFAENRPAERDKWIVLLGWNRAFPERHGALDASYRYYHDTYHTNAHTLDLAWYQNIGERFIVRPGVRLYDQTAADFYHYSLDGTSIVPRAGAPRVTGPFYSSDWRLSALRSTTVGVKFIWNATDALQFDAAFERYDMRGRDHVTPQSAYCSANLITAGARFAW